LTSNAISRIYVLTVFAKSFPMAAAKSNITVAIDSKLLEKVRAIAVRRGCSTSALLAKELHHLVAEDIAYEAARLSAESLLKSGFSLKGTKMANRDAVRDRRSLR
jgi:hypothetical protein